jgi:hypothetical protein
MAEVKVVEVDIDNDCQETVVNDQPENPDHLAQALNNIEALIDNLRLSYDIRPDKRLSDIIVAQELSRRELIALINQ